MDVIFLARHFLTRTRLTENLRLLQDSSLRELSVSINTRHLPSNWQQIVESELPVLICLVEDNMIYPVRLGKILEVKSYPNRLECLISCQQFVTDLKGNFESLISWDSAKIPTLEAISLPQEKLAFDNAISGNYWHRVAQSLGQLELCINSVFWRVLEIKQNQTSQLVLDLENDRTFDNLHPKLLQIIDMDTGGIIKQVDAMGSREVQMELPPSTRTRRCKIVPYPIQHYSLSETVEVPPSLVPSVRQTHTEKTKVHAANTILKNAVKQLWRYVDKHTKKAKNLETRIELLSQYVVPSFPDNTELVEELANLYYECDKPKKAYKILQGCDLAALSSDGIMTLFQASAAINADHPYEDTMALLDLGTRDQIKRFANALEMLGETKTMHLLQHLAEIDIEHLPSVVGNISEDYFTGAPNILSFSEFIDLCADDSADSAFKYLEKQCEKNPEIVKNPEWINQYISLGNRITVSPNLSCLSNAIRILVQNLETDSASDLLDFAKENLSPEGFFHLMGDVYSDLCTANRVLRALAAHNALYIIDLLLDRGHLYQASEWYERVVTTFGNNDPLTEGEIDRLGSKLDTAIANTEFGRDYRTHEDDAIYNRLRETMSGKTLVAVGWHRKPEFADELEKRLGLKKLHWFHCEKGQRFNAKPVNEALKQPNCSGLLLITGFMGHADEKSLASASSSLPVAKANQMGKHAVLNALDKAFEG